MSLFYALQQETSTSKISSLFCPGVVHAPLRHVKGSGKKKKTYIQTYSARNHAQRGVLAEHMGLPRHMKGWVCRIPATNDFVVSEDVYFDEHFLSASGFNHRAFSDALPVHQLHPTALLDRVAPMAVAGVPKSTEVIDDHHGPQQLDYFDEEPNSEGWTLFNLLDDPNSLAPHRIATRMIDELDIPDD